MYISFIVPKNIIVRVSPPGIPLNYGNSTNRRFPYNNQENYM